MTTCKTGGEKEKKKREIRKKINRIKLKKKEK